MWGAEEALYKTNGGDATEDVFFQWRAQTPQTKLHNLCDPSIGHFFDVGLDMGLTGANAAGADASGGAGTGAGAIDAGAAGAGANGAGAGGADVVIKGTVTNGDGGAGTSRLKLTNNYPVLTPETTLIPNYPVVTLKTLDGTAVPMYVALVTMPLAIMRQRPVRRPVYRALHKPN